MHRLLNTLLLIVGLCDRVGLRGWTTDDRMLRRYAGCLTDTNTDAASPDRVRRPRDCSAERRGDGGAVAWSTGERGSSPWGRSGPTTPATVNRSRRELREERGRKALGRGQSGIKMVPARLNARCAMVATECVATGVDWMAGDDDPGADDAAHP